ncbi:riboflavin biosynthesis protein RibF [Caldicellulosiruptor kronotskyensis 2002]|uniref:Riboflavin biosynthesis protein n=1 Tax=Caldicellulosiruptor kronotskyensis (strain DSM 18902 / VKM B-2412 / 2002) TaxID=632348 RepID=E4SFG6_CALK2|nr:bifunctional riboflavin kinase/FAD synthetase [Caldicellulosiruptor kronotskyensis]ADQ46491.1 riboflavin biosynthesis protein RibF [Caldicellulosiruptor kronotskyensis 2002]
MNVYEIVEKRYDNPAVALGFFDGFHIGHKKLFEVLNANASGIKKVVFTFKNHPDNLLGFDTKYILTNEERLEFFRNYGIDDVYFIEFNKKIMQMDKDRFIEEILIDKLNVSVVVVGYDFTFGYMAEGDSKYLCEKLYQFGRECIVIDPVMYQEHIVSSTLIRRLILEGNIKLANCMLGFHFFISGTVKRGNRLGKKMGFPTINIKFDKEKIVPKKGVYVTNTIIDDKRYLSITNVGTNPTVSTSDNIKIETHVLGVDKDMYGKRVKIEFIDFVREEKKFSNIDELKNQITQDVEYVKALFCKASI